ncbi:GNAT family N-acetyltransferase [Pseudonocardia sp. CA-107938]|uniref:GNAT family N-acetyltransferase n=1 Tax=Pseudonocardia sp. CA-107938 TaxID=3240021 RepID=UPI003D8D2886
MSSTSETTVADAPDRHRFEITVDGELAGFAEYRLRDDHITFVHTEIDDAFAGKGLAGVLVRAALDDVRGRGLRVVAVCPYVKAWIEKHPDYADLTRS